MSTVQLNRTKGLARWTAMLQKELLEQVRSFKLVWVPLVFMVLGIMQPLSTYYMPLILEKTGNLPTGTVIDIPMPSAVEVLASTLQQYGTIGVLVIALVGMGAVSAERNSGIASLILVKPIPAWFFISSKWAANTILAWVALLLGYGAAYYYTIVLFGEVKLVLFLNSYLVYGTWLTLIVTLTILFSTLLRSGAGAAFSAIGVILVLSLSASLLPKYMKWSPGALSGYAYQTVMDSIAAPMMVFWSLASTVAVIAAALFAASYYLKSSTAVDH
ncbi:ABC transporter permease [Paenibacillus sp. GXUN7292]|uniref:ABC transporter permease n=1 Tax=Paenibacillus sp. GXUN7292 TaxID=3422499 RepID=UPI003D7E0080